MPIPYSLQQLGWRAYYSQQLTLEELEVCYPARIASVHRSGVVTLCEHGEIEVVVNRDMQQDGVGAVLTVGDWVLVERSTPRLHRRLARRGGCENAARDMVSVGSSQAPRTLRQVWPESYY